MDQREEKKKNISRPVITFRNKIISPQRLGDHVISHDDLPSFSFSSNGAIESLSNSIASENYEFYDSQLSSKSLSQKEDFSPFSSVFEEENNTDIRDVHDSIDESPFVVHEDNIPSEECLKNQKEEKNDLGFYGGELVPFYHPIQDLIRNVLINLFGESKIICEKTSDFSSFDTVVEEEVKDPIIIQNTELSLEENLQDVESSESLLEDKKESLSVFKKIGKIFEIIVIIGIIGGILFIAQRLRKNVFEGLPDVSQIKDMQFQQATIITDRNGVELYKIFEENRKYVDISEINQNMINAIVAIEDQRFWTHDGLDPLGIIRSIIKKTGGASTIPQQLMTNLFDLKEEISDTKYGTYGYYLEKAKYKLRQIVLSRKLTTVLSRQIKAENPELTEEQTKKEMKKKILEIYLNYIEFGNNAFGVEAAAQSYFRTSAKELSILQSAILASFPKGPTQYSPFTESGRKRLMGYFICKNEQKEVIPCNDLRSDIEEKFIANLQKADFKNIEKSEQYPRYLNKLGTFTLEKEEYLQEEDSEDGSSDEENGEENKIIHTYIISYQYGRKDSVLLRMFEDQYITEEELINAIIEGCKIQFYKPNFEIKAPHFVFWIKDLLEEQYGNSVKKGVIVKTTLDYEIQKQAEEILKNNQKNLAKYQANNSSMLYVDTDQGDILAYVGSLDYFNTDIQGQNDMVRSPRQSGSSIKPLLYALGIMNLHLTIDSPIYDLYFAVNGKAPHNADGGYQGLLPLRLALGHSRNIPSVKIFQALGGENVVKPFYKSLGLTDIDDNQIYGYSLSLGAAEVPMLQLAQAYSHLTTKTPATINPILSITDYKGEFIFQKEKEEKSEIIPSGVKYLLWDILSNPNNRISGWINKFTIKGLKYALKTGTSNMIKNGKSLPRDGRMVAYLQNKLVLMWAGNADASPMSSSAYGGEIHAEPLKNFLKRLLDKNYIQNSALPKEGVSSVTISKITGKVTNKNTAGSFAVSTLGYSQAMPTQKENMEQFNYDADCFGVVSDLSENIKKGFFVKTLDSFMPNNDDIKSIRDYLSKAYPNLFQKKPQNYCPDANPSNKYLNINFETPYHNQTLSTDTNIIIDINGGLYLSSYKLYLDGQVISERSYAKKSQKSDRISKYLSLDRYSDGYHTLKFEVIAQAGYKESKSISLYIKKTEKITIKRFNVFDTSSNDYHINAEVETNRTLKNITISVDNTPIFKKNYTYQESADIAFVEDFSSFSDGQHSVVLEVRTQEGGYNSSIKHIYFEKK